MQMCRLSPCADLWICDDESRCFWDVGEASIGAIDGRYGDVFLA
jgi:hypothetical protein